MTRSEVLELLPYLTPRERDELDTLLDLPPGVMLDWMRDDPAVILSLAGMEPDPWQAGLLRHRGPETLLLCARQSGKSTAAAALILRRVLLEPDSLVLILSPGQRQSGELLKDKVLRLYDALGRPVRARRRMELSLELANGSRVLALPDNPVGLVGYSSVSLLVIDEAARVPDELYLAVRPMLTVSRGDLIALSTPYGRRGWFFKEWEEGRGWSRVAVRGRDCPRHTPEKLALERLRMGPRAFVQDYDLVFNDAVDQLFGQDVIDAATAPGGTPLF